jgi:hypothetical protein
VPLKAPICGRLPDSARQSIAVLHHPHGGRLAIDGAGKRGGAALLFDQLSG